MNSIRFSKNGSVHVDPDGLYPKMNPSTTKYTPRGGRPNYRYARWTPPVEPKPEPKLDLSDKSFPSLSNHAVQQSTAHHPEFTTSFATSVKVMAEVEKLHELRAQRDRQADQKARAELGGVYVHRFQHGRLSEVEPEDEAPQWEPPKKLAKPDPETDWVEVRHSKAHKTPKDKSFREMEDDYRSKAHEEEGGDDYNGDLFESSHRHDHHAT
jgi:hypothetical protein